ncbi:mitochondrial genome maintenance MGM101 [Coprinopsis marcescibilis]|uniref:Mitochondrial genome maintenance protein MGM101 n=1 Tax=Coprinopsis marcescibilis TaxID=230819 RepID=A0A5C3LCD9_COPMA|nr:mitochondrial genome maintenance MGM101 [Coprinopsis marcescibilis]
MESPLPNAVSSDGSTDWSRSYSGLSTQAFSPEIAEVLMAELATNDIEIKPDGLIYLPEIKYRRILNKAFGPGGWGLAPRSETSVGPKIVSREYALVCQGRLVAVARGEQEYFDPSAIATATEGCKSNALMRCCKDLGIASELWDPRFIREFRSKYCVEIFAEHLPTKKKYKMWRRKDQPKFGYPYQE